MTKVFRDISVGPVFFCRRADDALLELAAATDPDNPFLTGAYTRAQRALGLDAWIVGIETLGTLSSAALGVIKSGRIRRSLFINSVPSVPAHSDFWRGLEDFCGAHGITDLELATRASPNQESRRYVASRSASGAQNSCFVSRAGTSMRECRITIERVCGKAPSRG